MKKYRFTRILLIAVAVLAIAFALCPEYLRKAIIYQNPGIDDYNLFDNRVVAAGNGEPWEMAPGSGSREIPEAYGREFDKYKTVAYLVIRDRRIVFEKYWDGYNAESKMNSFAIANSIISLLVGAAIDDGAIRSADQPVGDFLPDFREGEKSKITIRHLLEMSSGLSWEEDYKSLTSMCAKGYYGKDLAELLLSQTVIREPGKFFVYQSGNTGLLALVLESATHQKVSSYASKKLWIPIGASHDALWSIDQLNGMEKAFCCFNTNARDFARFGQLLLGMGSWNEHQVVSEAYLRQALAPSDHLVDDQRKSVGNYGWNFWIMNHRGHRVYSMIGISGQYIMVVPDLNLVVVRFGHKSSTDSINGMQADFFTWLDAGMEIGKP